jgi:hypothetical protein
MTPQVNLGASVNSHVTRCPTPIFRHSPGHRHGLWPWSHQNGLAAWSGQNQSVKRLRGEAVSDRRWDDVGDLAGGGMIFPIHLSHKAVHAIPLSDGPEARAYGGRTPKSSTHGYTYIRAEECFKRSF